MSLLKVLFLGVDPAEVARSKARSSRHLKGTEVLAHLPGRADRTPIRLDDLCLLEEYASIRQMIVSGGTHRNEIVVDAEFQTQARDLADLILDRKPAILHFSGHGSSNGIYVLDDSREPFLYETEKLADLLELTARQRPVRLVLLNACETSPPAEALLRGVDFAIGMSRRVTDKAAIEFAAQFYRMLSRGESVKAAFDLGKLHAKDKQFGEAACPELHVRPGVDPAAVFLCDSYEELRDDVGAPKEQYVRQLQQTTLDKMFPVLKWGPAVLLNQLPGDSTYLWLNYLELCDPIEMPINDRRYLPEGITLDAEFPHGEVLFVVELGGKRYPLGMRYLKHDDRVTTYLELGRDERGEPYLKCFYPNYF
jgi:hypothetical protein